MPPLKEEVKKPNRRASPERGLSLKSNNFSRTLDHFRSRMATAEHGRYPLATAIAPWPNLVPMFSNDRPPCPTTVGPKASPRSKPQPPALFWKYNPQVDPKQTNGNTPALAKLASTSSTSCAQRPLARKRPNDRPAPFAPADRKSFPRRPAILACHRDLDAAVEKQGFRVASFLSAAYRRMDSGWSLKKIALRGAASSKPRGRENGPFPLGRRRRNPRFA